MGFRNIKIGSRQARTVIYPDILRTRPKVESRSKGFSLPELTIVVLLVTIVGWITVNNVQRVLNDCKLTKTECQLAAVRKALSMYEMDRERYPESGNKNLATELTRRHDKVYLRVKEDEFNEEGELLDGWGNPFVYLHPGIHNKSSYDLYSKGPNGIGDGNDKDDINNW